MPAKEDKRVINGQEHTVTVGTTADNISSPDKKVKCKLYALYTAFPDINLAIKYS